MAGRCFSMSLGIFRSIARPRCCAFSTKEKCSASALHAKSQSTCVWYPRQIVLCLKRSGKGIFAPTSISEWVCRWNCRPSVIDWTTYLCLLDSLFENTKARPNASSGRLIPRQFVFCSSTPGPETSENLGGQSDGLSSLGSLTVFVPRICLRRFFAGTAARLPPWKTLRMPFKPTRSSWSIGRWRRREETL